MTSKMNLAGEWYATWGDGLHGRMDHYLEEMKDSKRYMKFEFPGSIQTALEKAGIIQDPRIGINSLSVRWVEEHYWILRKKFTLPEEAISQSPHLCIDVLDGVAKIALNGKTVGEHWNANRPARIDLSPAVKAGENELVILLESGLFKVSDLPGKEQYTPNEEAILNKRHHLRQAQYQFGWDWNPRLIFFGLHGKIEVVWGNEARLEQVLAVGELSDNLVHAQIRLKPTFYVPKGDGKEIKITASAVGCCQKKKYQIEKTAYLRKGDECVEVVIDVDDPELWYPRGYGDPHLYQLDLAVEEAGKTTCQWKGKIGLRKVEILQPEHPEGGRYFHVSVNHQVVFWKGGNWVPPEMSAHEVDPARIRRLVERAIEQNMNSLRIWGGGVWAGHTLLDLCDENGILIWHDMLFACGKYPADRPEFYAEIEKEVTWAVREFSRHPSLIVWSGNNELEWGHWAWQYQTQGRVGTDYVLFHHLIPRILAENDPSKAYWQSSPYSSPVEFPNDPTRGDQHPWNVSIGTDTVNFWAYRQYIDRFPNEGGVLGCAPVASLKKFLSPKELKMRSIAWEHHDNTINFVGPNLGIAYQMVEYWLGLKVDELSVEEFALASGIVQAEGMKEYILNYRRRYPSTTSAIFWDYNDSWPTVTGWGTMDYYLNRRLSFHPVRRSFEDIHVVLADEGDMICLFLINQSSEERSLMISAGSFTPGDPLDNNPEVTCVIPRHSSFCVMDLDMPRDENKVYYALLKDETGQMISQERLLLRPFHEWKFSQPQISITEVKNERGRWAKYESAEWVWNAVLDLSGEIPTRDDMFDLLPGIPYLVPLEECQPVLPVITSGNELLLRKK